MLTFIKYLPDDPRAGGGEITVWNTIEGLAEKGHTIHAVTCKPSSELPETENIFFHITPKYLNIRPIDIRTSINWLIRSHKIKADIIHSFYAESFITNLYGRGKNIPVVQEIHYADLCPYTLQDILAYKKKVSGFLWSMHLSFARLAAKTADIVVTPSNYMKQKLNDAFSIPKEKISVIPVGVNEDVFSIRKKEEREKDSANVLFVGRLVREKGLDVLINAIKKIDTKKDIQLTVIGGGPLKNEYEKLSIKLGVRDKIKFVDWITRKEILNYFEKTDIVVVPSLKENFPRITLEAMGAGVPIIASKVGGILEQITDGLDGILVTGGNPDKLADSLMELLSNPEKRDSISKEGRKTARRFTIKKKIESLEAIYEMLLKR